jgi:hypothetical protein
MKRFTSLFIQDFVLAYRSGHVLITGCLLAGMLALIIFLPTELKIHNELILDKTPDVRLASYLIENNVTQDIIYIDEIQFSNALERQPSKVGVVYTGSLKHPHFEIITSNTVSEQNLGLLEASLSYAITQLQGKPADNLKVEFIYSPTAPPPFNLKFVPIMLVFEVVLLGFFIAAVLMFQEKQEGTLRAYRVTPARAMQYILSKTALFIVLSVAYGLPILLFGFGFNVNYGLLLLLVSLSSALMTLLSLAIAVFFRNLSEWFFVGVAVLVINSLPMISYSLPSFSPAWMTWIPSYPAVFATRDVLFNAAGIERLAPTLVYLSALNLIALAASYAAVSHKLLKEGR